MLATVRPHLSRLRKPAGTYTGVMLPSPCTKECKLDPATGLCRGCLRTMQEIVRWGGADEAEQARILAAVAKRRDEQLRGR